MLKLPSASLEGVTASLDGEREIIKIADLDPNGASLTLKYRNLSLRKKKNGAVITSESILFQGQKLLYKIKSSSFLVGAKNFKEVGISRRDEVLVPERAPDKSINVKIPRNQAAIYRLSGDYNSLHIDQTSAKESGFERPILHGLCTLGICTRMVMESFGEHRWDSFQMVRGRFSKPVEVGDEIVIQMWKLNKDKIQYQALKESTGDVVISRGLLMLHPTARL